VGREWIELEEATDENERLAELESQRTESKALTASLKQLVGTCGLRFHVTFATIRVLHSSSSTMHSDLPDGAGRRNT
jgi:hypothetical protein